MIDILMTPTIMNTLKKRYGFQHLRLFGSYSRGEQKENSDIDLVFEEDKTRAGYDSLGFIGAHNYLKRKLKKKVDLTEREGLHPLIKNKVLLSMKQLW